MTDRLSEFYRSNKDGESAGPSGLVTFLFTDVEGSTRHWAADPEATARSLEQHDRIITSAIEERGGFVFGWAGDHFRGAFHDPRAAVAAAQAAQRSLANADWADGPALRVRMGLHRGRATQRDGDYFGPVPNVAARVEALAAGGQILMTGVVDDELDIETTFLGAHRLRDVPEPVKIHQVGTERFRPVRTADPALSTLPNQGAPIIGRRDEVRAIRDLLDTTSMITLTGIGGCGKTRLALEVAHQELPGRADGCYFADLTAISVDAELVTAIATGLHLELTGSADPVDQLVAHLAGKDALLVLDNCEHVLDACAGFAERLLGVSSSTVLVATSRQRLGVGGETVVAVPPLEHDSGTDAPAIEMFVDRARAAYPSFAPTSSQRRVIGEICARLDGLPLAIELAAARVAVLAPEQILERMGDRFRLLAGGRGRHRRRTLRATLDWSFDLLDEEEQEVFSRLGLFVGSFDLAGAVAVSGMDDYDVIDVLDSLVSKNLLVPEASEWADVAPRDGVESGEHVPRSRYRMLESVRMYAAEQLTRRGEAAVAEHRYVEHHRRLTHADSFAEAASLDRALAMRWQWPNISSTLEILTEAGEWEAAAATVFGLQGLWDTHLPASEGRRWLEPILAALDEMSGDSAPETVGPAPDGATAVDPKLHDWVRYALASLSMQIDDWERTHRLLEVLVAGSEPEPQAQAAGLLAFLMCRQHPDRTPELVELGRSLCEEHGLSPAHRLPSEWARGCLALYQGRYDDARAAFEIAHPMAEAGAPESNQFVMSGLTLAASTVMTGDAERAIAILDSCDWSRSVWDSSPVVRAIALVELGRADQAAELVIRFGNQALRGRLARMANDALVGFAALAINRGEHRRAWELLEASSSPRSPFTIVLAEWLAASLGRGDEMRRMHRERQVPLAELDATPALQDELARVRIPR